RRSKTWWAVSDLNAGPSGCKPDALTAELTAHVSRRHRHHSRTVNTLGNLPHQVNFRLRHHVIDLYHRIGRPMVVNGDIKPIQLWHGDSGNGVKRGGNLSEGVVTIALFALLPYFQERRSDQVKTPRPGIVNRVVVIAHS